jgi:NADH dehydrogenase
MDKEVKILIVGNGFGGVYALKNLARAFKHHKNIKLSMVGERNYFLFTPLLHEVATGSLNPSNIIEPIREVLGNLLDEFYMEKVESVNLANKTVKLKDTQVAYDYLVLALGARTNFYNTPGAEENSFTLKNIEDAIKIKNHCIMQMERASHETNQLARQKMLKFVVVGGGATGVELATEIYDLVTESFSKYYPCEILKDASIVLIEKNNEILSQFNHKIKTKSLKVLHQKGIQVMLDASVQEIGPGYVIINKSEKILADTVVWVAGIKPAEIIFDHEISRSPDGRIEVNEFLQMVDHKEIFAVGDVAAFRKGDGFLPPLAQVAQRESETAAKNIKLLVDGKPPQKFIYRSSGSLISLGQWMAVGEIFGFTFSGHFAWWLWRTVYLVKFISLRKKIRVAIDWTMNLFSPRDISEL